MWGGEQLRRPPTADDVVAATVHWASATYICLYLKGLHDRIRIACGASGSYSLFLRFIRWNRRSNEYTSLSFSFGADGFFAAVVMRQVRRTVCVSLAAVVRSGKRTH